MVDLIRNVTTAIRKGMIKLEITVIPYYSYESALAYLYMIIVNYVFCRYSVKLFQKYENTEIDNLLSQAGSIKFSSKSKNSGFNYEF